MTKNNIDMLINLWRRKMKKIIICALIVFSASLIGCKSVADNNKAIQQKQSKPTVEKIVKTDSTTNSIKVGKSE